MGLQNVIYEQPAQPNPLGQALQSSAASIGEGMVKGQEIKRQQSEKLVSMTLQFLPNLIENPEALKNFTSHADFGRILGAFKSVGLGNVWGYDPGIGGYKINVPRKPAETVQEVMARAFESGDTQRAKEAAELLRTASPSMYGADPDLQRQLAEARERGRREAADANPTVGEQNQRATLEKKATDLYSEEVQNVFRKTAPHDQSKTGGFFGFGAKPKYDSLYTELKTNKKLPVATRAGVMARAKRRGLADALTQSG